MDEAALTRQQCREIDRRAIEELGIPGIVLMENAGRGCVDWMERLGIAGSVDIVCGKGNNAGDGFVIARHLAIRGYKCRVLLVCLPDELRGDADTNFAIVEKCGVPVVVVAGLPTEPLSRPQVSTGAGSGDPRTTLFSPASDSLDRDAAWIVDALLGTGAIGNPRPPFDAAIDWINARAAKTRVLAVDVPSGLDCDTGQPAAPTVRADHTCTFVATKIGFLHPAARSFTGEIHVCDIGVPPQLIDAAVRL